LRRIEGDDNRALRVAKPTAEDLLTDLTEQQLDRMRRHVRASIDDIEAGKFIERQGREGLKKLADRGEGQTSKLVGGALGHAKNVDVRAVVLSGASQILPLLPPYP